MKNFDIEARRKELNLTLEEIGKYVGVSKSTVKKWETGYIDNMKRDKIALLAKILEVSPLEIIGIKTDENQENNTILFSSIKKNKHYQKVIEAYIAKPEMQPAVDKLLGIEPEEKIQRPFIAAASGKEYTAKAPDEKTKIKLKKDKNE